MDRRRRTVLGVIWLLVAVLTLSTVDAAEPTLETGVRLLVVVLAVWLTVVYAFDPWDVLDRIHP